MAPSRNVVLQGLGFPSAPKTFRLSISYAERSLLQGHETEMPHPWNLLLRYIMLTVMQDIVDQHLTGREGCKDSVALSSINR